MFVRYLTDGIILKKRDIRDADQLFTVYTQDFGKILVLARASRKVKSKLRGGLKLFNLSQIEFIQGRNQKTLVDSLSKERFENISLSLVKLKIGHKISEILLKLTSEEEKDEKVWKILKDSFKRLNSNHSLNSDFKNYYYFFWNFINFIGFKPSLVNCSVCSDKASPPFYFSSEKGGLICEKCVKESNFLEISPESVKIIRIILENNWEYFDKLKIKKTHFESIKKITNFYYSFLLESMN
jgi:DNA repair protein RecO (recombination protein O)